MTNKEFFKKVSEKEFTDEVVKFAAEAFEKIAQKENERKADSEATKMAVLEKFTDENAHTATEISQMTNGKFSTQKVSAACRALVERGLLERIEPEKRNTPIQYRRVNSEEE